MNLAQLLVRAARVFPAAPAVYHGDRLVCDYRGLAERAACVAGALRVRLGLQSGERVAVVMENCPEYLEVLYGAWFAGLAAVPINARLHPKEVEFILQDSAATALFMSADLAGGLSPLLANAPALRVVCIAGSPDYARLCAAAPIAPLHREADDAAWLFYTSGTTGRPKGVIETHRNLLAMTACYFTDVDAVRQEDAIVYAAPMSHGSGLYNFPHVLAAARHVVPASGGFDPAELVSLTNRYRNVSLFARADHGQAPGRSCRGRRRDHRDSRPSSTAAARCTWPTASGRWRAWAQRFVADLRAGRIAR